MIGIILSGTLDDGGAGLRAIKRCGGITIIQDIKDAKYPEMPMNASQAVSMDYNSF
ncbi:chemotaxis protein CheB [Legionella saoudiensis]|uniref:chemotaxis protein CheB n=1 Tax=Legionella saoudiensis TaxID=1750561 RepID=UPI00098F5985